MAETLLMDVVHTLQYLVEQLSADLFAEATLLIQGREEHLSIHILHEDVRHLCCLACFLTQEWGILLELEVLDNMLVRLQIDGCLFIIEVLGLRLLEDLGSVEVTLVIHHTVHFTRASLPKEV